MGILEGGAFQAEGIASPEVLGWDQVRQVVSQGQGSLGGCRLWGHAKLDMTEVS